MEQRVTRQVNARDQRNPRRNKDHQIEAKEIGEIAQQSLQALDLRQELEDWKFHQCPDQAPMDRSQKKRKNLMGHETDPESDSNVTLKRLMGNPSMSSGGKEILNNLSMLAKTAGLKMIRISRIFRGKGKIGVLDSGATHPVRPKG